MEYLDLGVFMCLICMELLIIIDNIEVFMVIGLVCCCIVIFLFLINVFVVDFCYILKCLVGLVLIFNDFILIYFNDDFFFFLFEESEFVKRKERNYLFIVIYVY